MPIPVLICDDSGLARKQMARALPAGWNVELHFAANGIEALEAIEAGHGDILFLDLNMPAMDGYQVLEAIRNRDLSTLVIVVSGDIQPQARERVLQLGALDFIRKPVNQQTISDILDRYGILGELTGPQQQANERVELTDCYREIVNVAMGRAAERLALLLGVFIKLPIPRVNLIELAELQMTLTAVHDHNRLSAVTQGFSGSGIAGEALLLFHDSDFEGMAELMDYQGTLDDEAELELLMDLSNLLIGACLNGIAEQLDVSFSQSHPMLLGQHGLINDLVHIRKRTERKTLAVEIDYGIENHTLHCTLLLLFTEDSINPLNERISYILG